jgi:predicted phage-related endonuclease
MPLDHELRRTGFTSTEIPALLGCDETRDAHSVVAVKAFGQVDVAQDYYLKGKYFEGGLIEWYGDKTGKRVEALFDKTFRHPKYPHVLATPDALVVDESRGVDAKVASFAQRHQWGATADDTPDRVQIQIAILMEVLNRNYYDIALYCADQFRIIEFARDREFGEFLCVQAERMWDQYVERREWPPIGGSKISAAWLQKAYPSHKRPDLRVATDAEIEQLRRYGRLKADQKLLAKERVKLENWLKDAIKDREGLVWDGGRFTWRRTKNAHWQDWESMALALLTHYVKDEEARKKLLEEYTRTQAGSRRVWFSSDESFVDEEEVTDAA